MRQTSAQSLGRKGERWFQNVLPKEWIFQKPTEDFGLDGTVIIADPGYLSGLEFGVQVKASGRWLPRNGFFAVAGVKYHTLIRWASPLMPTLLVLYDETHDCGYYGWVKDIMPDVRQLIASRPDSVTLKIPSSSALEEASWAAIRAWLQRHHENLLKAVETKNVTAVLLPTIHDLMHGMQLLLMAHWSEEDRDEEAIKLRDLSQFTAHRAVITCLTQLLSDEYMNSQVRPAAVVSYIERFIDQYRSEVQSFIPEFAATLGSSEPSAFWINTETMVRSRPKLVLMISGCIATLSSIVRDPTRHG
jgi:Domain of unknown function (DUF4365)